MDISKGLTYATEDKEWATKLGLGTLISLVPVLNFAWNGYMVEILRNVAAGRPLPLPTWDNLEKKFVDGLKLTLAQLIYGLPAFILLIVPVILVVPAFVDNENAQAILATLTGAATLGLLCLLGLYLLAFSFMVPAIQLNFARKGTFGACFQVGAIVGLIRTNMSDYLTAWLASVVVGVLLFGGLSAVLGVLNVIPCLNFIFALLTLPVSVFAGMWFGTVHAYLFGQVGIEKSGQSGGYISA